MDWYYKQHDVITETVYLIDNELTMRNLVRTNVELNAEVGEFYAASAKSTRYGYQYIHQLTPGTSDLNNAYIRIGNTSDKLLYMASVTATDTEGNQTGDIYLIGQLATEQRKSYDISGFSLVILDHAEYGDGKYEGAYYYKAYRPITNMRAKVNGEWVPVVIWLKRREQWQKIQKAKAKVNGAWVTTY